MDFGGKEGWWLRTLGFAAFMELEGGKNI